MIQVGIIGGAGYTAGELIRILLNHPECELLNVVSSSHAGNLLSDVHRDLVGETDLRFSDTIASTDIVFLCAGHGKSLEIMKNPLLDHSKVIDLSADFRLDPEWHYGLPELEIKPTNRIANPGCFATAIQLALLPIAKHNLLTKEVHVHALTGSTGAGQSISTTSHFSWRFGNVSIYKAFEHQHLAEISKTLDDLQGNPTHINFIPVRGAFTRGIFASAYTDWEGDLEELVQLYQEVYSTAAFTHVTSSPVDLKQVVNTNKCLIHLSKHGDKILITSVIDNLLKGASGQAVQNMNLLFRLDEKTGLQLKSNYF